MDEKVSIELHQRQRGDALVHEAKALVITDDASRKKAAEFVLNCAHFEKAIDDWIGPDIAAANKLHKSLTKKRSELKGKAQEAKDIVNAEIKRDWLEFEAARQAVQELKLAEAERESAETGEFVPAPILPETERRIDTGNGYTTIRKDIKVTVVDKMAVIRAVANGELPDVCVEIDTSASKKYFKSGNFMKAPGFKIEEDAIVVGKKS